MTDFEPFEDIKLEHLEDRLKKLQEAYREIGPQYNNLLVLGGIEGAKLKNQLEELQKGIESTRNEYNTLKSQSSALPSEKAKRNILERIEESEVAVVDITDRANRLNPYKGLEAFTEKDAVNFFGLERDCDDVINKIKAKNHTMVTGSSGNGKSSLAMAGVLPRLREEGWLVAVMTPGDDPNFQLVSHLRDFSAKSSEIVDQVDRFVQDRQLAEKMEKDFSLLRAFVSRLDERESVKGLLLYIDQFESLFAKQSLREPDQQFDIRIESFLNNLWLASETEDNASSAGGKLKLLISLRSEFIGQLSRAHEELAKAF